MRYFVCKLLFYYLSVMFNNRLNKIVIIFHYKNLSQSIGSGNKTYELRFTKLIDIILLIFYSASLSFGEAYLKGNVSIKGGLDKFIFAIDKNFENQVRFSFFSTLRYLVNLISQKLRRNSLSKSIGNVRVHYDQDPEFYKLFLDSSMQYSCAYFSNNNMSIEEAQYKKKDHISKKLLLNSSLKVLDIGCGWGGLSLFIAKNYGCFCHGITLSINQLNMARDIAKAENLNNLLEYSDTDYRNLNNKYDRIVSIGMFEHVGLKNYDQFFNKVSTCLKSDGIALIHTIGRIRGPGATDPFLSKYIFPGGYIPSLSEILPSIEKNNLIITDIEFLHLHYATTLNKWREKFFKKSSFIKKKYGKNYMRMWEYYLIISESAFRTNHMTVFQIQLAKKPSSIPSNRDYIYK